METTEITFQVKRAKSLDEFKVNGKRNMYMHYFQLTPDGWLFKWVEENTTAEWLQEKINEGVIYVFE